VSVGAEQEPPVDAVIVRGLEYTVPEKRILHDVNLTVPRGGLLAIMGKSGCGKTSLLKCMAGLVKPSGGEIVLEGQDIVPLRESELDELRLKIGLVFQYAALFDSLTVFENVAFGLRHHRKTDRKQLSRIVAERLADVGMEGTEPLYPSQLSGGMQKRVGLARALAMEPAVLLYDEPTSGLDPVIARNIDELILNTRSRMGMTSIIVSHDIESIFRIADHIAMLDEGTVIAYGTPEEMRASDHPKVREFVLGV
jgi:phospholipid/cholesterol/gamma-HCH transport system ATP-binding protein